MHAISSYRGNRPTTNTQTHKQTDRHDRLQYTAPLSLAPSVTKTLIRTVYRKMISRHIKGGSSASDMILIRSCAVIIRHRHVWLIDCFVFLLCASTKLMDFRPAGADYDIMPRHIPQLPWSYTDICMAYQWNHIRLLCKRYAPIKSNNLCLYAWYKAIEFRVQAK